MIFPRVLFVKMKATIYHEQGYVKLTRKQVGFQVRSKSSSIEISALSLASFISFRPDMLRFFAWSHTYCSEFYVKQTLDLSSPSRWKLESDPKSPFLRCFCACSGVFQKLLRSPNAKAGKFSHSSPEAKSFQQTFYFLKEFTWIHRPNNRKLRRRERLNCENQTGRERRYFFTQEKAEAKNWCVRVESGLSLQKWRSELIISESVLSVFELQSYTWFITQIYLWPHRSESLCSSVWWSSIVHLGSPFLLQMRWKHCSVPRSMTSLVDNFRRREPYATTRA